MADVDSGGGGDHGKHGKKGRKKSGNPRVDMTPMVDLAFLLLTFFVLTSNLNKAKTMEMAVPKDTKDTALKMKIDDDLAHTIILEGNKQGKIYVYAKKFNSDPPPTLNEFTLDPKKGIRQYMLEKNTKVSGEMKNLRKIYKSGKLTQADYDALKNVLVQKSQASPTDDSIVAKRKKQDYSKAMARLDKDLVKQEMSDTTYRLVSANIRNDDKAPFFIIKWGGDAKYNDVINIIDELKIADISKYALTKVSRQELQALSGKTGIRYPELSVPEPAAPAGQ